MEAQDIGEGPERLLEVDGLGLDCSVYSMLRDSKYPKKMLRRHQGMIARPSSRFTSSQ